jgi:diguanylate cyclase (GGDEF)-like protein
MHNIGRCSREYPVATAVILTLLCAPLVVFVAWVGSGKWQAQRLEGLIAYDAVQVAQALADAEAELEIAFEQMVNIATWVAEDEKTVAAIASPHSVPAENRFLNRTVAIFGVADYLHVMNARGEVVASSNADVADSAVGENFSYREFFQDSMQGVPSRQFAIGQKSGKPGFYFSAPVQHHGEIVGVSVVKLELHTLKNLVRIPDGIITDKYGVVVLSENPAYLFMAVPGATVDSLSQEQAMARYARAKFPLLPLKTAGLNGHPEIMLLGDKPVRVVSHAIEKSGWSLYLMRDFNMLSDAYHQRIAFFVFSSLAGCSLLFGLWTSLFYFLRSRDYRRKLEVANSELKEMATRDFLTGCLNRRAFADVLKAELERSERYATPLSMGMLDIDHFKRINDSRGHDGGDIALRFLSDQIHAHMRSSDILARLGGEEFAWLMPNTTQDDAVEVVDRMRERISGQAVQGLDPPLLLSFSAGVSAWQAGMEAHALINTADEALYEAKESGRNRVVKSTAKN